MPASCSACVLLNLRQLGLGKGPPENFGGRLDALGCAPCPHGKTTQTPGSLHQRRTTSTAVHSVATAHLSRTIWQTQHPPVEDSEEPAVATAEDEAVVTVDVEDAEGEEESAMRRRSGESICSQDAMLPSPAVWRPTLQLPVMQPSWARASETVKLTLRLFALTGSPSPRFAFHSDARAFV